MWLTIMKTTSLIPTMRPARRVKYVHREERPFQEQQR